MLKIVCQGFNLFPFTKEEATIAFNLFDDPTLEIVSLPDSEYFLIYSLNSGYYDKNGFFRTLLKLHD